MTVHLECYGNGYRPTAEGTIGGRRFFFRMNGAGGWYFGVERDGAPPDAWASFLSSDDSVGYDASGEASRACSPETALPIFVNALATYLTQISADAIADTIASASAQARALIADA